MATIDYTKMRVGKVTRRWTYTDRATGEEKIGTQKVQKCQVCGQNCVRSLIAGTFYYHHSEDHTARGGFVATSVRHECKAPAAEADKETHHPGYYCVTVGCWRERGRDTEGQCSKHQKGLSGPGIKAALAGLLDTHRLGEAQFTELRELLRRKLDTLGAG